MNETHLEKSTEKSFELNLTLVYSYCEFTFFLMKYPNKCIHVIIEM
jgi:hypothetical protein